MRQASRRASIHVEFIKQRTRLQTNSAEPAYPGGASMTISRRVLALASTVVSILVAAAACFAAPAVLAQGALEKPKVHIAVGGKNGLYYLPLTIAERLGYFKDE